MESGNPVSSTIAQRAANLLKRVPGGEQIAASTEPVPSVPKVIPVPEKTEFPVEPPKVAPETLKTASEPLKTVPVIEKDYVPDDPSDEIEQLVDGHESTGLLKRLRTKLKTVNKEARERAQRLEQLEKKVSDYETGIALPELTAQQTQRIEELEKYEKLYNLKASPAYREKFILPVQAESDKLKVLASEYGVDEESLQTVFQAESSVEAGRLLSQLFQDDVGALEAKSIFRNIKKIQSEAREAEQEPAKSYVKLQEENHQLLSAKRARENEAIAHVSREAWSESLHHLRADNRFPEIVFREGDTEHNEKYVRPLLTKAGQEYGKIVRVLAEHGLTELPKDVSVALARMTQLAHHSAVSAIERERLSKRVTELESLLEKRAMNRPGVNNTGGGSNGVVSGHTKAVGPYNAGMNVLNRVMGKV